MQTLTIAPVLFAFATATMPATAALAGSDGPGLAAECAVLPRATMHVRLVLEPDVPQDLRAQVESTVATIWRGEGLTIEWLPYTPPGEADPRTSLWLRVTTRWIEAPGYGPDTTLGAVRFLGGVPHHDVLVSWTAVREWARAERDRQFRSIFVGVSRDASLEFGGFEVLARRAAALAAAHEVGHFILASKTHDKSGLMRRGLMPSTVAAVEHPDLSLSVGSRQRLQDRLAQGATCANSPALVR
jgi:hypothetical protein